VNLRLVRWLVLGSVPLAFLGAAGLPRCLSAQPDGAPVPLAGAAALGALAFGHVQFGVTASLAIGSVPGVFVGSLLSSTAPDRYVRPVITFVVAASG